MILIYFILKFSHFFLHWRFYIHLFILTPPDSGRVAQGVANHILGVGRATTSPPVATPPDQIHNLPADAFCFKVHKKFSLWICFFYFKSWAAVE